MNWHRIKIFCEECVAALGVGAAIAAIILVLVGLFFWPPDDDERSDE